MALSVGQRIVRIDDDIVRDALACLIAEGFVDVPTPYVDDDERIVEASVQLSPTGPHTVVFVVEKSDVKEKKDEHQESLC